MTLEQVRLSAIVDIGAEATVGGRLGPYRLLERVGTGAYAAVYRGRHDVMGVERAIKVPRPPASAWPEHRERFLREARVAARLRHPNVVGVHDCATAPDGTPYIVMELVAGRSLAERLEAGLPAPTEMLWVAGQVARALDHAHAAGVVHRDVKPANVLLADDGTVRLGDFGIAHLGPEPEPGEAWAGAGTPAYMAPEQRLGRRDVLGPHTDVYGLAAVVYEMLTGRPPGGEPGVVAAPCAVNPYLPPAVDPVLTGGLAGDPGRRPASAGALVADLAAAVGVTEAWQSELAEDAEPAHGHRAGADRPTAASPLGREAPAAEAPAAGHGGRARLAALAGRWRR
jgi:serine/threonine-protein kinase